jgi:hypothetical protein
MRGPWLWGTLTAVWTTAIVCGTRVWCGTLLPIWLSTLTYLVMGWGAIFCYNELARTHSHRKLFLLPLGGLFYSIGAVLNLMRWPALVPGVFASHEIFHFFVIAGTTCHVIFMLAVVIPSPEPTTLPTLAALRLRSAQPSAPVISPATTYDQPHFSWKGWVNDLRINRRFNPRNQLSSLPPDNAIEVA